MTRDSYECAGCKTIFSGPQRTINETPRATVFCPCGMVGHRVMSAPTILTKPEAPRHNWKDKPVQRVL